jgi:hypothetical protein
MNSSYGGPYWDYTDHLLTAVYHKNIPKIKEIIEAHPDVINRNITQHLSVLSHSVIRGLPPDLIEFLIEKGAYVNNRDLIISLLHNLDESSDFEIARLLIKNGADINYTGGNFPTALEAVIKDDVGAKDGSKHSDQVGMKKKILNFLFNIRDSEGRRVELDCQYKDEDGLTIFELAKEKHGAAFEAFLRKKCSAQIARNITAAEAAWMGNTSESSGFGRIPRNVMGEIYESLGAPRGKRPDGTRRHLHPAFVGPILKSGVKIPKGHERQLSQLYEWAKNVRLGTSKAREMRKAAEGLVSLSQRPYYVRPNGKTVRYRSQLYGNKEGGRRRITRRRR